MKMERLPCPFCGGTDVYVAEGSTFRWVVAICNNCDASAPESRVIPNDEEKTRELALAEWNRRASPTSVPAPIEHEPLRADESMSEQVDRYHYVNGWNACREAMLAAAPTPPSTEDRKDAERYRWLCDSRNETRGLVHFFEGTPVSEYSAEYKAIIDKEIDQAMQEDMP